MKDNNYLFPLAALALCCLALNFAPDFLYCRGTAVKFLLLPGLAVLACAALYLKKKDCLDGPASLFLLGSAAFLLHASFVLAIPYDEMQHDLFGEYGHPACIKSFLELGFPCNYLSSGGAGMYYHPPLSPALAALWLKLNLAAGMPWERALENIQILPLFYTGCATIAAYGIFRELKLKGAALAVSFALFAFHPSLTVFSGFINNDPLCFLFCVLTVLFTLRWHNRTDTADIMLAALCLGLSSLSKASGGLAVPALAFIFLHKFYAEKELRAQLCRQFALFLTISAPLCLAWPLFCKLVFGFPFDYVPHGAKGVFDISALPLWRRFFDFAPASLSSVFMRLSNGDHNMITALVKSSLFGEFRLFRPGTAGFAASAALLAAGAVLFLFSLCCSVAATLKSRGSEEFAPRCFCSIYIFVWLFMYCIFCLKWPCSYTQNFRYVAAILPVLCAAVGFRSADKPGCRTAFLLPVSFCVLSFAVWTLAAL